MVASLVLSVVFAAACNEGKSLDGLDPEPLATVHVTPGSVSLQPGATLRFAAYGRTGSGDSLGLGSNVAWTATGGTIAGDGTFTAGSTSGTFSVTARETTTDISGSASVTVSATAPTLVAIELTPATTSVQSGSTRQFSVVGRLSNGNTQSVTPSYNATGGTISNGGLYTAGATAGTGFRVIATASGFADTASVTITAAPVPTLVAIELSPSSASLNTGGSQQFSVIGRMSDGGTQAVTPSYQATGGTISTGGLYSAGGTAGNFRVIATASGFADTSSVTLTAPGQFAPPDLVDLSFNSAADDTEIENGGASFPGQWHTADATGGRNGSRAIRITVSPQFDNGFEPIGPVWPNRGRVFVRWYFRTQGTPGGNVKGFRFHSNFSNNGELYGGSPCWAFDFEPANFNGACFSSGIYYGGAPTNDLTFGIVPTCTNLADGNWHWIEVDYDRNAGSNVEVRLWCDGKAVVLPIGAGWFGAWNQTVPGLQWVGGNLLTNTPTTWRVARSAENYLSGVYMWPNISQASGTATVWVDDLAVSTQRIGP